MTTPNALVTERRRLLEQRRAEIAAGREHATRPTAGDAWPRLMPRDPAAPIPMSFAHELLWMLETASPGTHGYNVSRAIRLRGHLDIDALQRALDALIARHEVLRSTFDRVDGEPRQIVHAPRPVRIELVDVRGAESLDARVAAAAEASQRLSKRPFDLTRDLQLRATIIRIADDDQVFLLESHHVASDAWSRNILFEELATLYEAFVHGRDPALPDLPLQYGDFAVWQRNALRGERLESLLAYWRGQLADAPTELALPTDRVRTLVPSADGAMVTRILPRALLDQLLALSREQGVTLFMTLLAAFDVLLSRYSGQDDVVVGSPMAGRSVDGVERIVGYFADTLVLRTRLDGNPTFLELLARVRRVALDAYEHQAVPYEKLVLELAGTSRDARAPLFRTMFTLHDAQQRPFRLHGLETVPFAVHHGATKFDLSLFTNERADGLRIAMEYRTDLFDAVTIERMVDRFATLLESIVADPTGRISDLRLLTAADEARLVAEGTGPRSAVCEQTLGALVGERCVAAPDVVAIDGGEPGVPTRLTLGELHRRVSALAETLRERGVRPGVGVGVCAERSPELVVALLGVLAAGGYYVPMDPDYPRERLVFMADDSGVPVVLATRRTVSELGAALAGSGTTSRTVVRIDECGIDRSHVESWPLGHHDWSGGATADDLAYLIYTSGSTGRPKGVRVTHRSVVNYLLWMRDEYAFGPDDAILQRAPASFDVSIWELFLPLITGGRVVLAPAAAPQDPAVLVAALRRHDVCVLQLVPSQLRMVLESGAGAELASLRRLFVGGEALPRELLAQLQQVCPDLPVTNLYGPTEATVFATHWDVEPGSWTSDEPVLIGAPVRNLRVYVLDEQRRLVPEGAVGEIVIAGVGVAAGYLNRPELTAERFIPDPFGAPGETAYRTGDHARLRARGGIEYLGRADGQVKLRGFRIELGEIDEALSTLPAVSHAITLVRELAGGEPALVSFLVLDRAAAADTATVRAALASRLPHYMLPSVVITLESIPTTANGKVDRKALEAMPIAPLHAPEIVAPRTATESTLGAIWAEVLGREGFGVRQSFFDLGGHSLLAMRIVARIDEQFGLRLPLGTVLEHPTIEALAAAVDARSQGGAQASVPEFRRVNRVSTRRAIPAQETLPASQHALPDAQRRVVPQDLP